MKNIKYIILSLLAVLLIMPSCKEDKPEYDNKVYVESANKPQSLLFTPNDPIIEKSIYAELAKPENEDINLTYKVDLTLVDRYNKAYYDNAVALDEENYEFVEKSVKILSGTVRSTEAKIRFINLDKLDMDMRYVLPVTIAESNIDVLESSRTVYYVLAGAALINVVADMEKNYAEALGLANPSVLNGLNQLTIEALIYARDFDREISTVMGIEGSFLMRIGDANFPSNQIQIATPRGNFPGGDPNKGLPTKKWVHVALTYDRVSGSGKIYIDGALQSESNVTNSAINLGVDNTANRNFCIGHSYNDERYLAGYFSECRIWNIIRTQEEIASSFYQVPADSPGLVAYWKFNDGEGSIIKDHTANGNHLIAKEPVKWHSVSLPEKK